MFFFNRLCFYIGVEQYGFFPYLSGNMINQLDRTDLNDILNDPEYTFYYLNLPFYPFRGLNDYCLNLLTENHIGVNSTLGKCALIPPDKNIEVRLFRDNSIDLLHLLYPISATRAELGKTALSAAEAKKLLTFTYSRPADADTER